MNKNSKIYVAGHNGLVGSALVKQLQTQGYNNLIFTPHRQYDLRNQQTVSNFFKDNNPQYVIISAARVGGIYANSTYPAEFIYDSTMINSNIIHQSFIHNVKKLLFIGSSCIYPKNCPQPIRQQYLLTGELQPSNEPYAISKISAIKMCQAYRKQYGCDFISIMPCNIYGINDNFDLTDSHVLPALIRKLHLAKLYEQNKFNQIYKDFIRYTIYINKINIQQTLQSIGITKDDNNKVTLKL